MLCSISGTTPEEPVISIKSGYIYEKRLIEKYIEVNGKEPVTNESLSKNELVSVKIGKTVKPRPTNATSIPSMLQLFQNEWDSLMLETFTLKQQYENVRQELAQSIYQYDAACRVIARLMKERDQIKNEFMNIKHKNTSSNNNNNKEDVNMEDTYQELSKEVQDDITSTSETLIKKRKQRSKPTGLPTVDDIKQYKATISISPHASKGVTCIDNHQNLIVTGGNDNSIQIFDIESRKITSSINNAHSKPLNQVQFHSTKSNIIFSCSQDKSVKVFSQQKDNDNYTQQYSFNSHKDNVTGISLHPTGNYLASCSLDKSWNLYDINTGSTLLSVHPSNLKLSPYESIAFAPDGLILALGTSDKKISIWEVNSNNNAINLEGYSSGVRCLTFSENGYSFAAADNNGVIKLWDLRKVKDVQEIKMPQGYQINSLKFDYSGSYLSAVGTDITLFNISGKTNPIHQIQTLSDHTDLVTDVVFSKNTSIFATSSLDSTVKIWAKPQ